MSGPNLKKILVEGGAAIPLSNVPNLVEAASWGEDGNIVAGGFGGLVRISDGGGPATIITEPARGEEEHATPQILPGGKAVLFEAGPPAPADPDKATVEVVTLADRHRKVMVRGTAPRLRGNGKWRRLPYL